MEKEKTFVMIKPDAVQRGLVGEIINRFEKKGIKIVAMKLISVDKELAEKHYGIHKGKPFFEPTVKYITSSPVIAIVLEGINAIEMVRGIMGKTDPQKAEMGTIRGDFSFESPSLADVDKRAIKNLIHASGSVKEAKFERQLWFKEKEIIK